MLEAGQWIRDKSGVVYVVYRRISYQWFEIRYFDEEFGCDVAEMIHVSHSADYYDVIPDPRTLLYVRIVELYNHDD